MFTNWNNYTDHNGAAQTLDWSEEGMRGALSYPYCRAVWEAYAMRWPTGSAVQFAEFFRPYLDLREVGQALRHIRDQLLWALTIPYADQPVIGWVDPAADYSAGSMGEMREGVVGVDPKIFGWEDVLSPEEYAILQAEPMSRFGPRSAFLRVARKVFLKLRRFRTWAHFTISDTSLATTFYKYGEPKLSWAEAVESYEAALTLTPGTIMGEGRATMSAAYQYFAALGTLGYRIMATGSDMRHVIAPGGPISAAADIPFSVAVVTYFDAPPPPAIYNNSTFPFAGIPTIYRVSHISPAATSHDFVARFGHLATYGDYTLPDQPAAAYTEYGFHERARLIFDYAFPL